MMVDNQKRPAPLIPSVVANSNLSTQKIDSDQKIPRLASGSEDRRLQIAPFSVLLPKLGDVSGIGEYQEFLRGRWIELKENLNDESTQAEVKDNAELAMLAQVLQWLDK